MTSQVNAQRSSFQENWDKVTTHSVWRHTIGRVSCLMRIPLYITAAGLQLTKTVVKGLCSIPITLIAKVCRGEKELESWTFKGVQKDALATVGLIDRVASSILCTFTAPPKSYRSFKEATLDVLNSLIGQHQNSKYEAVYRSFIHMRAQYQGQIIDRYDHLLINPSLVEENDAKRVTKGFSDKFVKAG